ncbi:MAG: RrF2 family transcriptional regulator [Eubacterium sp.]|jgi:Rrf2 family protein|nr:RrF2 family transcriptional regulator [Eubacterium sp.]NBI86635.1 Rrf2 family transcriptional regulator [Lachnospiraceae bacterium]
MKISTKGRYALRLMLDIAMNSTVNPVPLKDTAERQSISVKYLEQIISALVRVGYVKSIRGPQGGYRLAKAPADYTVGMILRQVEGSMVPVACLEEGGMDCTRQGECVTLRIWKELDEAIRGVLEKYTLEDLIGWQEELGGNYVI